MIFALGGYTVVFEAFELSPFVMVVGLLLSAIVLQGACLLFNKIARDPRGRGAVPTPRLRQALWMMAVAVVVNSLVTFSIVYAFRDQVDEMGLLDLSLAFLVGLMAISVVAARVGVPLRKSPVVMLIPNLIAFAVSFPQVVFVSIFVIERWR